MSIALIMTYRFLFNLAFGFIFAVVLAYILYLIFKTVNERKK